MVVLSDLVKLAILFDATPDADKSSGRDLDEDASESGKYIHNLACFFAEDFECWSKFCGYVESLRSTENRRGQQN